MLEITFAFIIVGACIFSALLPFLMLSSILDYGTIGNCVIFIITFITFFFAIFILDMLRRKYHKGKGIFRTWEWYCNC